jgi:tryptophan synthase alpha subunit
MLEIVLKNYCRSTNMAVKQVAGANIPLGVGFGIGMPAHVRSMIGADADGVIGGSVIIEKTLHKSGKDMLPKPENFALSKKVFKKNL